MVKSMLDVLSSPTWAGLVVLPGIKANAGGMAELAEETGWIQPNQEKVIATVERERKLVQQAVRKGIPMSHREQLRSRIREDLGKLVDVVV